jgi:uridine kinase
MTIRPREFDEVADKIETVLDRSSGFIVAIDGRDGVGKTTLGRFLSWRLNVSLIECDLHLKNGPGISHRTGTISRLIAARVQRSRPVIVEGVKVLEVLHRAEKKADFLVWVDSPSYGGSDLLRGELSTYESVYGPKERASIVVSISHGDDSI